MLNCASCILCRGPDTQHTRGDAVAMCSVSNLVSLFILPSSPGAVGKTSFLTLPKHSGQVLNCPVILPPLPPFRFFFEGGGCLFICFEKSFYSLVALELTHFVDQAGFKPIEIHLPLPPE